MVNIHNNNKQKYDWDSGGKRKEEYFIAWVINWGEGVDTDTNNACSSPPIDDPIWTNEESMVQLLSGIDKRKTDIIRPWRRRRNTLD